MGAGMNNEDEEKEQRWLCSTLRPAVLKLRCTGSAEAVPGHSPWVMVAEGWAALYFEQATWGLWCRRPCDHTVREWVPGKESASQAPNRFSINI